MFRPIVERRTWEGERHDRARFRVCFLYNAQLHQLLHTISIAAELARRPEAEVEIWATNAGHIDYARTLMRRMGAPEVRYVLAGPAILRAAAKMLGRTAPPKRLTLASLAARLRTFDAIVTPERTSIALKAFGLIGPAFIHTGHGAGDRAGSLEARLAQFDLTLVAGPKTRDRLEREGLIRRDANAIIGYPKFEAADAARDPAWRPFDNGCPTVLYNPHFRDDVSSWAAFGLPMLEQFAAQRDLNLIFAPHIRLFDGRLRRAAARRLLAPFAGLPNIHIDLGGPRAVDMTYTAMADLYVGDASSQVYEYLRQPRPCMFLDGRDVTWRGDESHAHWTFGPVVKPGADLPEAARAAIASHAGYVEAQTAGVALTFDLDGTSSSRRAADVIATFVERRMQSPARSAEAWATSAPAMQLQ